MEKVAVNVERWVVCEFKDYENEDEEVWYIHERYEILTSRITVFPLFAIHESNLCGQPGRSSHILPERSYGF